jgi:arylsulfatase A-like enzyme/predicted Zn-dependent protease
MKRGIGFGKADFGRRLCLTGGFLLLVAAIGCGKDHAAEIPIPGTLTPDWMTAGELPAANGETDWNLLLITLDTTRQDHLGCYGYRPSPSPNLDNLARQGVIFERAVSPVPITNPSHSTMMTGLNPYEHGVRNNGSFVLPESQVTLAEVLSAEGYATGATVAAYPVEATFGLGQGFDTYNDDFEMKSRYLDGGVLERYANKVTDISLAWIETHRQEPFFHWAHYYDPHFPYEPPKQWQGKFTHPYDGEIAYMDAEIGRLIQGVRAAGLMANTWIVIAGDHGEALGEHGESAHGIMIYGGTQNVPFIIVPPENWQMPDGATLKGKKIDSIVGLRDIAPTFLNAIGREQALLPFSGSSLLPLLAGTTNGPQITYTESLIPALDYGWGELRGIRTDRWSYIRAPEPELYDLKKDPTESQNVYYKYPEVSDKLEAWLEHLLSKGDALGLQAPDPGTIARLRSLGYLGGSAPTTAEGAQKDPKALIHLAEKIGTATRFVETNSLQAKQIIEEVLVEDPGNMVAERFLGKVLLRMESWLEAKQVLGKLYDLMPEDVDIRVDYAKALIMSGAEADAEPIIYKLYEERPDSPERVALYAELLTHRGEVERARKMLQEAADAAATDVESVLRWARLEISQNNPAAAQRLARQALQIDGSSASAHAIVAEMMWSQLSATGEPGAADADKMRELNSHLDQALASDPSEPMAAFRKAKILHNQGNLRKAAELYQLTLTRKPNFNEARVNLGGIMLAMQQPQQALALYREAREQGYESLSFLVSYGVACAMLKQYDEARSAWELALTKNPDPAQAEGIRENLKRLGNL